MMIKDLLHTMVCSIVDDTANIKIEQVTDTEKELSFKVTVAKDDVGKLIGTQGRIATAMRTLLKAAGAKQGVRVLVNIDKMPL